MSREQAREDLLQYLRTIQRPEGDLVGLADDEHLVDAGVLDSLAVLRLVVYLEEKHGLDLVARGVDPTQLVTIGAILDVIEAG